MKVLLLHDYGVLTGGAEHAALRLRENLRRHGHDARIFVTRAGGKPVFADYTCFGTTSRARGIAQTANPDAARQLHRVLREFKPDVAHLRIFLTQLSPLILPELRDTPTIYHAVWYRAICMNGQKLLPNDTQCSVPAGRACLSNKCVPAQDWPLFMMQLAMFRRWRKHITRIVAISEDTRRRLEASGLGPATVLWNGIPESTARSSPLDPPTVVFAGRLTRTKGPDVLVRAFAEVVERVPTARLLIAGDGPERANLQAQAQALGVESSVAMLGHLPFDEMERNFRGAWVQVMPGRWAEPFGNAAGEALMRGTPLITSNLGGTPELVRDGETGFVIPPDDVAALVRALMNVLADRSLAARMGDAARDFALKQLGEDSYCAKVVAVYEEAIQAHALARQTRRVNA